MKKPLNILLTGGHSGIGLELTKRLLGEGHRVGLVVRKSSRGEELPSSIRDRVEVWEADLAIQEQVVRVAREVASAWPRVDVLFNNAGVLLGSLQQSAQNNEMHLEVNALAPYLLTRALKPALDASPAARVINTATSNMHKQALELEHVIEPKQFRKLTGAYLQSKLALTLLMIDLAKEPSWATIRVRAADPGPNSTGMTKNSGMPFWLKPIAKLLFPAPTRGAGFLYDAAFDSAHSDASGIYLTGNKAMKPQHRLLDEERRALLDRITMDLP